MKTIQELEEEIARKEEVILKYSNDVSNMKKKFKYVRDSNRTNNKNHIEVLEQNKEYRRLLKKSLEIHHDALQTCKPSTCEMILRFFSKPTIKKNTRDIMEVLGIGTVIEFNDCNRKTGKISDTTYVDRISAINLHSDGTAMYWTELYPESTSEPEIGTDRIIRVIEEIEFNKPYNLPTIPANVGELISFILDDNKRQYGIVSEAYNIIDKSGTYDWRMLVGEENYYLCGDEEEDYKIKIERVADEFN